jgi:hypothetical protein
MQQAEFESTIATMTYVKADTITKHQAENGLKNLNLTLEREEFNEHWASLIKRAKRHQTNAFEYVTLNGMEYLELTIVGTDSDWCRRVLGLSSDSLVKLYNG